MRAGILPSSKLGKFLRVLDKGEHVDIVEIQRVGSESTIRGRLAEGGWISIKNEATGKLWALRDKDSIIGFFKGAMSVQGAGDIGTKLVTQAPDAALGITATKDVAGSNGGLRNVAEAG